MQFTPSPLQPVLQAHVNDPLVSVQLACASQLSELGLPEHSLISEDENGCCNYKLAQ